VSSGKSLNGSKIEEEVVENLEEYYTEYEIER
jgi:hypothetical protein